MNNNYYEIDIVLINFTDRAILCADGYNRDWIPRSCIKEEHLIDWCIGENYSIEVLEQFLIDKGWA